MTPHDCDPHLALARSESAPGRPLVCCDCGGHAEGNISTDAGAVCDRCHAAALAPMAATGAPALVVERVTT